MKNKNLIILVLTLIVIGLAVPVIKLSAQNNTTGSLEAFGIDTISGFGTSLYSTKTAANKNVVFEIAKPDGQKVSLNAFTQADGTAHLAVPTDYLKQVGDYLISAHLDSQADNGTVNKFTVYPGNVSAQNSVVKADKSFIKSDLKDAALITVQLMDDSANVFKNHMVKLISSRNSDFINLQTTNSDGSVIFKVTSATAGDSVLTAIDQTANLVLNTRINLKFSDNVPADAGGNDLLDSVLSTGSSASIGTVNNFGISDFPAQISPSQDVGFKVTARDQTNQPVQNYTGTVHFSIVGDNGNNAHLPDDYTFKAEDLGSHKFDLGLKFSANGTYKLQVTDVNNPLIQGQQDIVVGAVSTSSTQQVSSGQLSIKSPQAGGYSQSSMTISGDAPNGAQLQIFDNNKQIGTTTANGSGVYAFQTGKLDDGKHSFYVAQINSLNAVLASTKNVDVNIDTTAPVVDSVQIAPATKVKPGTMLSVTVNSESKLQQAVIVFNSNIVTLTPNQNDNTIYEGTVQAPTTEADYPIDVILVDQLGNQGNYKAQATVTVSANATVGGTQQTVETQTQQTESTQTTVDTSQTQPTMVTDLPPSQVIGVKAYGANNKVTLIWEPANDDKGIKHYRVYYGENADNLDKVADTFTNKTTWYVPNLVNNKNYFFELTAVDTNGQESQVKSDPVAAIPFNLEIGAVLPTQPVNQIGSANLCTDANGATVTCDNNVLLRGAAVEGLMPPSSAKTGPELLFLILPSGVLAGLKKFSKRNR